MDPALTGLHSSKWLNDTESLAEHLRAAGFVEVQGMQFRSSRILGLEEIGDWRRANLR
jgi:hypothetical protein